MKQSQITYWCHEIIRSQAEEGGYYIDATMGKGNDTLFLCELAGEKGKVLAFDIQQEALDVTKELLKTHGKETADIARQVAQVVERQAAAGQCLFMSLDYGLVQAMNADAPCPITTLRVDGGASVSDIMMQTQADLLRLPVDRPAQVETTAFGAAALAGLAAGVWGSLEEVAALRRSQHVFLPQRPQAACEAQYRLWRRAVDRALRWIENDV